MLWPLEIGEKQQRWFYGIAAAAVLAVYGGIVLTGTEATIRGRRTLPFGTRSSIQLAGADVTLYGLALIAGAAALHFTFWWMASDRWHFVGQIGQAVSLLIFAGLVLMLIGRQFVNWL
jgi:hypothetical protein